MIKHSFFKRLIYTICFLFLFSCGNNKEEVKLRLTHAENKVIEKMYTQRLDSLRSIWDSLCTTHHDAMVAHALDSIINERLEEEDLLRSRLRKK